ncbi:MAG: LytR/AlgR family response regulator transcription factor [Bacillota bacterium]|uniref:Stage 0 sporulation protein A homolog n=1 Tax=Thermanaerosceptrum fracticalcis TaxID=1712410 RepID=A0A7G6E3S2_THEFR|nr:LytTR family DNA-binding domain-containing protein [Thermanaerosceptrum fracticalcis]QNB46726.1 response regulator [Thermanaerosceptrum fracticalcis]
MNIRALVVDDERPARNELIYLIKKIGGIEVCGEASSALEALKKVVELRPELVFLDIQMEPVNGIVLARKIMEDPHPPFIVFATAYDKYAVEAFEINAMDYILKPFSEGRIRTTIERILDKINENKSYNVNNKEQLLDLLEKLTEKKTFEKIPVWQGDRIILLDPEDIVFIVTTEGKNTVLKTVTGEYEASYSIGEMEESLSHSVFFKPHRSFLINLNYIKEIEPWFHNTYQLVMKNYENEKIPVSRNRVKEFKKAINLKK